MGQGGCPASVRVLWRIRTNRMYADVQKEIYCRVSAHVITETEKSRELPCASWRLWRAVVSFSLHPKA